MRNGDILDLAVNEYIPSQHIMNDSEEDYVTEDDLLLPDPVPSGRSSISSFPASIIHHNITPSQTFPQHGVRTPSRSRAGTPTAYQHDYNHVSSGSTREYITGFRNPSSVRALQMRDEFSDPEDFSPGHRRRGSRMSYISHRSGSVHSTPGKRMSKSLQGSPVKNSSRLRKEFPLVLLHCSMLPSLISPKAKSVSEDLLEAIVPEPYKKRWKLLQEKIMKNFEVRERGVLIPHPREDYDMLEEKLLESLELEQPVVRNGHFVGRSESRASATDSGFGSEENSIRGDTTDEGSENHRCADCGGQMCGGRRWEVKVFAANGLLRAGAWSAAWSEMEKVDVQVSVWLPDPVRQEIEARLEAVIAQEQQLRVEEIIGKEDIGDDERTREIYGEGTLPKPPGDEPTFQEDIQRTPAHSRAVESISQPTHGVTGQIDLQVALRNYVRLLLQDKRNIAILFLSLLLISYGISGRQSFEHSALPNIAVESPGETRTKQMTTTVFSTTTSTALEVSTVTETLMSSPTSILTSTERITTGTALSQVVESSNSQADLEQMLDSTPASDTSMNASESLQVSTYGLGVEESEAMTRAETSANQPVLATYEPKCMIENERQVEETSKDEL